MTAASERELDLHWMRRAISAASEARERGEVPIGTCIVLGETVLAVAGNRTRTDGDPTAHAEIVALREAAAKGGNYRLPEAGVFFPNLTFVNFGGAFFKKRGKKG